MISNVPLASGLAVDWLSHCIYITVNNEIIKYDTTLPMATAKTTIAKNERAIYLGVVIDPLKRYMVS